MAKRPKLREDVAERAYRTLQEALGERPKNDPALRADGGPEEPGGDAAGAETHTFMQDVAGRLANRVQLTTDGHHMYLSAVAGAFHYDVDYAMLVKHYGKSGDDPRRYSPAVCTGIERTWVSGNPDPKLVSTSFVERSNLTMRMQSRRFTRLTNAYSKKAENHAHAVALMFMYYNFCRPHMTLTKRSSGVHTTPARAAGLTNRVWKIEDVVGLMDPRRLLEIQTPNT